jgi:AraC family transcriptional regulator of adaptative response/methylated-DNA-[protein]-cysteine methyltransferase
MNKGSEYQYISVKDFEKLYQEKGLTGGTVESPLGPVIYRLINGAICGIGFENHSPHHNHLDKILKKNYQVDEASGKQVLNCLVNGQPFPMILAGTTFQHKVWQALLKIPKGQCFSYQRLAEKLGDVKKVRAVASAVGRNPVSWIVPCHRVVHKQGGISNYLWGSDIKAKLLEFEGCSLNKAVC